MNRLLKSSRDLLSAIIREKVFRADVPYMIDQRNYITSKQKKRFIEFLNKSFPFMQISLLEIGSRGGLSEKWKPLLELKNLHLEGIEPDKKEAEALRVQKKIPYRKIYPLAVYNQDKEIDLFVTKALGCTSIYEPNIEEIRNYENHTKYEVQRKIKINAKALDSIIPLDRSFDFVNMDVQGAEYDVFLGGERILKKALGVVFEAHFFPYYKKEKLFPDIHNLIKDNFSLLKLNLRTMGGEISEIGDAVYSKNHNLLNSKEDLLKQILFCVLFERKERIEFLIRNHFSLLSSQEIKKILSILGADIERSYKDANLSLEEWNEYSANKNHFDGSGY